MDKLAIVILNYNGRGFLEQFLPSVLQYAEDHPVYVADNGSTDDSLTVLRANFPTVRLIVLATNNGYAGGYNTALDVVRNQFGGAEYYCLLNSDVEVTPGWIAPILTLLDNNGQIAACQPKIRDYNRRDYFEHAGAAGGFLDWLGYVFCRGRIFATFERDLGQFDDNRAVVWATGACLFMRAAVFHQTGGFDAAFFAHMEEIDWCWRVQRAGYQVWACGQSAVYHVGGGTLPKANPHKTYLNYRNSLFMLYKNWPANGWFLPKIMLRLVLDGASSLLFLKVGQWQDVVAILRAHFAFYGHLPVLIRQRRKLQEKTNRAVPLVEQSVVWAYFMEGKKTFMQLSDNRQVS